MARVFERYSYLKSAVVRKGVRLAVWILESRVRILLAEEFMQEFRSIDVWKKAHALVLAVYKATKPLPADEVFGISIQLRRGATGIATRIAEGSGRDTNTDFAADLRRAIVATKEVEYLLLLANDLQYLDDSACTTLSDDAVEVRKMIHGLLRKF